MKSCLHLLTLLAAVTFFSCSKHNSDIALPVTKPAYIKDVSGLLFKAEPVSNKEVQVLFSYTGNGRDLSTLLLKKDTTTVGTYPINKSDNGSFSADITYDFSAGQYYNFVVQTNTVSDTIYSYNIKQYTHIFKSAYAYQMLLPLQQFIDVDIAPSRNYMFVEDDINNTVTLKRLSLLTNMVDYTKTGFYSRQIRGISDDEFAANSYEYKTFTPGTDSVALAAYNITTGKTRFIDWGSSDYGRISRVVDGHLLVSNPIYTGDVTLVNLADNSKIVYPGNSIDFTRILERSYDNIYFQNQAINTTTGDIYSPLHVQNNEGIEYIDKATGLGITSTYNVTTTPVYSYTSSMNIYKGQNKIFSSDAVTNRLFSFPKILREINGAIVFAQTFGYDTVFDANKIDGYYALDLNTNKVSLIQCDGANYISDFQLDDKNIISVRTGGIYRLTKQ